MKFILFLFAFTLYQTEPEDKTPVFHQKIEVTDSGYTITQYGEIDSSHSSSEVTTKLGDSNYDHPKIYIYAALIIGGILITAFTSIESFQRLKFSKWILNRSREINNQKKRKN